jgi:hypothetical protein
MLRNQYDLYEPFARIEMAAKFPLYLFPKLWNNLNVELKTIRSKNIFINKLKTYVHWYLFFQLKMHQAALPGVSPQC